MVGGNYNNGTNAGLWYFNANNDSSNSNTNIGGRLLVWLSLFIARVSPHRSVKILSSGRSLVGREARITPQTNKEGDS